MFNEIELQEILNICEIGSKFKLIKDFDDPKNSENNYVYSNEVFPFLGQFVQVEDIYLTENNENSGIMLEVSMLNDKYELGNIIVGLEYFDDPRLNGYKKKIRDVESRHLMLMKKIHKVFAIGSTIKTHSNDNIIQDEISSWPELSGRSVEDFTDQTFEIVGYAWPEQIISIRDFALIIRKDEYNYELKLDWFDDPRVAEFFEDNVNEDQEDSGLGKVAMAGLAATLLGAMFVAQNSKEKTKKKLVEIDQKQEQRA